MSLARRAASGALGGLVGTLILSVFRQVLATVDLVGVTAPQQVVAKLEEIGLLDEWSPEARQALTIAAHLTYGTGIGTAMGLLRRKRCGTGDEMAVGSALGILSWSAGWTGWMPLTGVHAPPWEEETPRVLLPVLDHAVYGAAWGLAYRAVRSGRV